MDDAFELLDLIGEGGMARIHRARLHESREDIAVKMPQPGQLTRPMLRRFDRECDILEALRGIPGIPGYRGRGQCILDGETVPYLAMDLVGGHSLREVIDGETRSTEVKLSLIISLAHTLHAAHERGVVHRDVKPDNVRVTDEGPVLLDFGVGRLETPEVRTRLTQAGDAPGTFLYMSPEQARGDDVLDARSDVYSLAVVAYEFLTGALPYGDAVRTYNEIISSVVSREPIPPRRFDRGLASTVEIVLLRALSKDPGWRHPTAAAFASDLRAAMSTRASDQLRIRAGQILHTPRRPIVVGLVLVALVSALVAAWQGTARESPREALVGAADNVLAAQGLIHTGRRSLERVEEALRNLEDARTRTGVALDEPGAPILMALLQMRIAEACLVRAHLTGTLDSYVAAEMEAKLVPNFQWSSGDAWPPAHPITTNFRLFGRHLNAQLRSGAISGQATFERPAWHVRRAIRMLMVAQSILEDPGCFAEDVPEYAERDYRFRVANELASLYNDLGAITDSVRCYEDAYRVLRTLAAEDVEDIGARASYQRNLAVAALGRGTLGPEAALLDTADAALGRALRTWGATSNPAGHASLQVERVAVSVARRTAIAPDRVRVRDGDHDLEDTHSADGDRSTAGTELEILDDIAATIIPTASDERRARYSQVRAQVLTTLPVGKTFAVAALIDELGPLITRLDRNGAKPGVAQLLVTRAELRAWLLEHGAGSESLRAAIRSDLERSAGLIDGVDHPALDRRRRMLSSRVLE